MAAPGYQHNDPATTAATSQPQAQPQPQPVPTSIPVPSPILVLPRCVIRAYHPQDAERMALAANNPGIAKNMRNTFPNPYTLDSAKSWIGLSTSASPMLNFGIHSPDQAQFLGGIGLQPGTDIECRTYKVGYWIAPAAWGKGLATEALVGFCRWTFETFADVLRLEGEVFATNEASARVLTKAGFVHEGTRRGAIWKNGEVLDLKIFGLLREECLGGRK